MGSRRVSHCNAQEKPHARHCGNLWSYISEERSVPKPETASSLHVRLFTDGSEDNHDVTARTDGTESISGIDHRNTCTDYNRGLCLRPTSTSSSRYFSARPSYTGSKIIFAVSAPLKVHVEEILWHRRKIRETGRQTVVTTTTDSAKTAAREAATTGLQKPPQLSGDMDLSAVKSSRGTGPSALWVQVHTYVTYKELDNT